tara:strand:- start:161 stop:655 length:495 start_codon:yes stop_codon:yes gene_type:complete
MKQNANTDQLEQLLFQALDKHSKEFGNKINACKPSRELVNAFYRLQFTKMFHVLRHVINNQEISTPLVKKVDEEFGTLIQHGKPSIFVKSLDTLAQQYPQGTEARWIMDIQIVFDMLQVEGSFTDYCKARKRFNKDTSKSSQEIRKLIHTAIQPMNDQLNNLFF